MKKASGEVDTDQILKNIIDDINNVLIGDKTIEKSENNYNFYLGVICLCGWPLKQ